MRNIKSVAFIIASAALLAACSSPVKLNDAASRRARSQKQRRSPTPVTSVQSKPARSTR